MYNRDDEQEMIRRAFELSRIAQSRSRAIRPVDVIAAQAVEHWQKNDVDFYICENPAWEEMQQLFRDDTLRRNITRVCGRWNGYCKFQKFPGIIPGTEGIYTYVPVHGGLTFFQEWADGSVTYGFDTSHAFSSDSPIEDIGWVRLEAESMARGIQIAARFEPYFLKAGSDNNKKARVLVRMGQFLPLAVGGNLGAMLRLLTGEL